MKSKRSADLDQTAQLVLSHPSGSGAWEVTGDLHLLHGPDVKAEVCSCGGLGWTDVHDHQLLHQTRLQTETEEERHKKILMIREETVTKWKENTYMWDEDLRRITA